LFAAEHAEEPSGIFAITAFRFAHGEESLVVSFDICTSTRRLTAPHWQRPLYILRSRCGGYVQDVMVFHLGHQR
jgi:hypothetical protein